MTDSLELPMALLQNIVIFLQFLAPFTTTVLNKNAKLFIFIITLNF